MLQTCVNERVAGSRHFSVGGTSPVSHDPYQAGVVDHTCIFTDMSTFTHAESYGRVFATSEERTAFLLEHGYIRPYYRRANETLMETSLRKLRSARSRLRAGLPVSYPS